MKKGLFHVAGQLLVMVLFASIAYAEFGLLLASFKSRENAEKYATRIVKTLTDPSYHTFVEETEVPGKGSWYRVCLGPFLSRKEAVASKEALASKGISTEMIVVRTKADARAVPGTNMAPASSAAASQTSSDQPIKQRRASDGPIGADLKKTKDITLRWDPQKDPTPAGYKIYYDTKSGPPYRPDPADYVAEGPPPIVVKGDATGITLHGLTEGKDYYFAITAFESPQGPESPFSNEIAAPREAHLPSAMAGPIPKKAGKNDLQARASVGEAAEASIVTPDQAIAEAVREEKPGAMTAAGLSQESEDRPQLEGGDTVEIEVPGQAEMSIPYDVAPDGNIYMISVGKVSVQGMSLPNLERNLTLHLKKFLDKGEKVSAKLVKRERYVQITGGVRYPGWYRVPRVTSLKGLVDIAGGLLEGVTYSGIKLKRETPDGYRTLPVSEGRIALQPNDILIVPSPEVYQKKVDAGDLLFINVPGRGEGREQYLQEKIYKLNQFEVDSNGYVYIPDVGHIYVRDFTTAQIKEAIAKKLPKYLAGDAKMDVSIIEKRQFVQVLGHVANPGVYIVREGSNVQAALNVAGGAVDGAVMSDAKILRKRGAETERIKINLYQFTITGDPRLLTPLHEDDILFVPISPNFGNIKRTLMPWTPPPEKLEEDVKNKVRIFGAVNNPGTYEPKEEMNLVDLMIAAGGEREGADVSKVLIIRKGTIEQTFNLKLFLSGESDEPLPKIKNGDTVYVKFRELTIYEPEEDKVFYVLGEVRSPNQYKLSDNMTLFQAISLAGGFTEWADTENITIVRMVNGKQQNFRYNLGNGIAGRVPERNTLIFPGDTIYVP